MEGGQDCPGTEAWWPELETRGLQQRSGLFRLEDEHVQSDAVHRSAARWRQVPFKMLF